MKRVISVDPGAVHCGVAVWVQDDDELWTCTWAVEMSPEGCTDFVRTACRTPNLEDFAGRQPDEVICEGFWLKPGVDAMRQAGSEMETCEVIGALRHLCRWAGVPFQKVANGQDSIIKRLRAVDYPFVSRGHGVHAKDAEAVGVRGLGLKVRQLKVIADRRAAQ